jgi:protein-S-isoprenylcysteine O-methyltransferase Ste14
VANLPPVLAWLTLLSVVAWVGLELPRALRSRPEARRADRGSRPLLGVAAAAALLLGLGAARVAPGLAVSDRTAAAWCGLVLLWAAVALRQWSIRTLGRYFTLTVQTSADQPVVATGPYRFVRHPAYTAILVAAVAAGLYLGSWLSVVAFVAVIGAALVYRISVEERALTTDIGPAYREYAATHKRLVPFVW